MPTFRITAPDGATYRVDAPEGATEADALERVKAQASAAQQQATPSLSDVMSAYSQPEAPAPKPGVMLDRLKSGAGRVLGLNDATPAVERSWRGATSARGTGARPGRIADTRPVLDRPVPQDMALAPAPLIEQRGAPVASEAFEGVKAQLAAMPRAQRLAQEQRTDLPGWMREAARAANQALDLEDRGAATTKLPGSTIESRADFLIGQGASASTAAGIAKRDALRDAPTNPLAQATAGKPSLLTPDEEAAARAEGQQLQNRSIGARGVYAAREGLAQGTAGLIAAGLHAVGDKDTAAIYEKVGQAAQVRSDAAGELQQIRARAMDSGILPDTPGARAGNYLEGMAVGAANSVGQMVPSMAAGTLTALGTGNPVLGGRVAMGLMTAPVFGQSFIAKREAGGTPAQAAAYAAPMAALEWIGERYGLVPAAMNALRTKAATVPVEELPAWGERIIASFEKRKLFSQPVGQFVRTQVGEQIGEQITGAGQYLLDGTPFGLDKPISLRGFLENARDTAVQTVLATGVMQAGGVAARKAMDDAGTAVDAVTQRQDEPQAEAAADAAKHAALQKWGDAFAPAAPAALTAQGVAEGAAPALPMAKGAGPAAAAPEVFAEPMQPVHQEEAALALPADGAPQVADSAAAQAAAPAGNAPIIQLDTPLDRAAHDAATSPTNDKPDPSPAQQQAGSYAKGHVRVAGLDIAIENPQGSVRRGVSPDGKAWETPMHSHYGYFKGTTAIDGDAVDVFVKPGTPEDFKGPVFVVDQIDPKTGRFDEHKAVLGATSLDEARQLYLQNYEPGWKGVGSITQVPMAAFKSWVKDSKKRQPLGDLSEVQALDEVAPAPAPASTQGAPAAGEAEPAPAAPLPQPRDGFKEAMVEDSNGKPLPGLTRIFENGRGGEGAMNLAIKDGRLFPVWVDNGVYDRSVKGTGGAVTSLYEDAIKEAQARGLRFTSDDSVTVEADRVYDALARRGHQVTRNPKARLAGAPEVITPRWVTDDGAPVYEVGAAAAPSATHAPAAAPAAAPAPTAEPQPLASIFKKGDAFDLDGQAVRVHEVRAGALIVTTGKGNKKRPITRDSDSMRKLMEQAQQRAVDTGQQPDERPAAPAMEAAAPTAGTESRPTSATARKPQRAKERQQQPAAAPAVSTSNADLAASPLAQVFKTGDVFDLDGKSVTVAAAKASTVIVEGAGGKRRTIARSSPSMQQLLAQVTARGTEQAAASAPAAPATHADPGQAPETASPAVVKQSLETAARRERVSPGVARERLLEMVDEAIAAAGDETPNAQPVIFTKRITTSGHKQFEGHLTLPDGKTARITARETGDKGATAWALYGNSNLRSKPLDYASDPTMAEQRMPAYLRGAEWAPDGGPAGSWTFTPKGAPDEWFVTFDVPGDGEFKVLNTKAKLQEFRAEVEKAPGFSDRGQRKPAAPRQEGKISPAGSASAKAAIEAMVDEGDAQAAVDYAAAKGLDLSEVLKGQATRLAKVQGLAPTAEESGGASASALEVDPGAKAAVQPKAPTAAAPARRMRTYGWDRVKLAGAYSLEQLEALRKQVETQHANPRNESGRYLENGRPTIHLYDKEGRRKLDALAYAVTYKLQEKGGKPLDMPSLSRSMPPAGALVDQLRATVDRITAEWAEQPDAPHVRVVATALDLPEDALNALYSLGAEDEARGLRMSDGRVFLVADKLRDVAEGQFVLFHETYGHHGLRAFLGKAYGREMLLLRQANPALRREADSWFEKYGEATIEAAMDRGFTREQAELRVRALATEEALADRAGSDVPPSGWKGFMARLQRALRRMGLERVADRLEAMSEAETWALLRAARATVRGAAHAYRGEPAMAATKRDASLSRADGEPDNSASESTESPGVVKAAAGAPHPVPVDGGAWGMVKAKAAAALSPDRVDTAIYRLQDRFIDLKRVQQRIQELGGVVDEAYDAYLSEELFHGRVAKRTQDFMRNEVQPLVQAMKDAGVTLQDLETYLHARHAQEANAAMAAANPSAEELQALRKAAAKKLHKLEAKLEQAKEGEDSTAEITRAVNAARAEVGRLNFAAPFQGTEEERLSLSGMSDAAATAHIEQLSPEQKERLEALAARVDAITSGTLDALGDGGLVSGNELQAWRAKYRHYVPLFRDEAHPDSAAHPIGSGFSIKGAESRRRTGSNAKVTHILGHILMQREAAITRSEKNLVAQQFYTLAAVNPDAEWWQVRNKQLVRVVNEHTGLVESRVDPHWKSKPGIFMAKFDGEEYHVELNERNPRALRLAASLKNLDMADLGAVMSRAAALTRYFAAINTQYNPVFGIVNFLRDAQGAMLNLSSTPLIGKERDLVRGAGAALRAIYRAERGKTALAPEWAQVWEEFQAAGAQTGYRDLFKDAEDRARALAGQLRALDRGASAKAAHAVLDWLGHYNEAIENAFRLSAYKLARDGGLSTGAAASLAKNLTVNFNRKGQAARELGALYAFFNASVQGTARLVETLRGPRGRQIIAGGVLLGVLMELLGRGLMDDDEWDKVPAFVKERSLVIPVSGTSYVSLPLPLGLHVLPNAGRLAAEWVLSERATAGRQVGRLLSLLAESFNPVGTSGTLAQTIAPTVADPAVALWENRDWTGKRIYMENRSELDQLPGHQRAKDSASSFSMAISKALNWITGGKEYVPGAISWTPDQIDYVLGAVTGGLGREIMKVQQTLTAPFLGEELPVHKIPLLGRFVGTTAGVAGNSDLFIDQLREVYSAENQYMGLLKENRREEAKQWLTENPVAGLGRVARKYQQTISALREQRAQVLLDRKDGFSEKAEGLQQQIGDLMNRFNKSVTEKQKEAVAQ